MARTPTVLIRIPATQAEAAQSATGLPQGPAVRACLAAGIGQEDRLLTLEEWAAKADAAMDDLRAAVRRLEQERKLCR